MSDHEARAELIGQVETGQLSIADAEAEALRRKLGSLASVPNPDTFDPAREVHWSLSMTVAWIAYRDIQKVREQWNEYRLECWDWHGRRWRQGIDGPIYEGAVLEQRSRATLPRLGLYDSFQEATGEPVSFMTIRDAREALWIALQTDCFTATAIHHRTDARQVIQPMEWYELEGYEAHGQSDELRNSPVMPSLAYRDIWIPSGSVMRLWPLPTAKVVLSLPPLMAPVGDGYMPLSCAAQWIATTGGALCFDPADEMIWRHAYGLLMEAIAADKVRVVGSNGGRREPVPGFNFADCQVSYPLSETPLDLMMSTEMYLRTSPYVDEDHWRNGFDDALIDRYRDHWTRLMVHKGDVRERWPFDATAPRTSGAPGRPSSMHLILDEFERRIEQGKVVKGLAAQARALGEWLVANHPLEPRPTAKTIAERIRERYRQVRPA